MKHMKMIITMTMINELAFISMIVSFSCIVGICGYIAIPNDIKDIKRILKDIRHG